MHGNSGIVLTIAIALMVIAAIGTSILATRETGEKATLALSFVGTLGLVLMIAACGMEDVAVFGVAHPI